ncbi:MAG: hypothetical protein WBA44_08405 [Mesorhizobium sp.]
MQTNDPFQLPTFGPINRPPRELVEQFRGVGTSAIGSVLDEMGVSGIVLNIKPLAPGSHFVGTAYTVKEVTGAYGSYPPLGLALSAVVDNACSGDVILIDNGGQQVSTWGGLAAIAAKLRGVAGLVVDGGIRDRDEIIAHDFPAFSRHIVALSGKTRIKIIEINTIIKIDGVKVAPGDIIVADGTGVACIPQAIAPQVLVAAKELEENDRRALSHILAGSDFRSAIFNKYYAGTDNQDKS